MAEIFTQRDQNELNRKDKDLKLGNRLAGIYNRIAALEGGVDQNDKVRTSSGDAAAGFLLAKMKAGTNITLSEVTESGTKKVQVDAAGGSVTYLGLGFPAMAQTAFEGDLSTVAGYIRAEQLTDPLVKRTGRVLLYARRGGGGEYYNRGTISVIVGTRVAYGTGWAIVDTDVNGDFTVTCNDISSDTYLFCEGAPGYPLRIEPVNIPLGG